MKRIIEQLPADNTDKELDAMLAEIKTLVDLEFAKWMDMPDTAKPLPCRMLEKIKYFADGKFDKGKMRFVVQGFFVAWDKLKPASNQTYFAEARAEIQRI